MTHPSRHTYPTTSDLSTACAMQLRFSSGRGARHVIVLGHVKDGVQHYFVVTENEAQQLRAAGYEPLWKS